MKSTFKILLFISFTLTMLIGIRNDIHAADDDDIIINTQEAPSESYLKRSKRTMALDIQGVSSSAPTTVAANPFSIGSLAEQEQGNTPGGNMGGSPIGDATFPMILSLILLFFVYRGVTINKRKNI